MRLKQNPTQLSTVECVAHSGHDHVFRPRTAVHVSMGMVVELCVRLSPATSSGASRVCEWLDGWWLSCGCVSEWFIIKSHNTRLQEENEEIINHNEAMIDKQIIAISIQHVRGVARLFGMPGEGFPRANQLRSVLSVCTRRCKAPIREGSLLRS